MKQNTRKEPFIMPEGYLDKFTTEIMSKIPLETQPVLIAHKRSRAAWYSAAAITLLLCLSPVAYLYMTDRHTTGMASKASESQQSYNMDDIVDYAMLDHQDIYEIISE
ncbi:MAG: hypothetical protein ACI3Y5_07310 [Prevotella sp.]